MKLIGSFLCVGVVSSIKKHDLHQEEVSSIALHTTAAWKRDCGKKKRRAHHLVLASSQANVTNPGAGMNPESIEPFTEVHKDGYFLVACVKDAMYEVGDKFGNNKFDYKMGPVANSSIVHYTDHVAKEDREAMTHNVCFDFCRGIPDMGYFGISNGRDCYCTSYYKPMASDSSECDSVCEGDNTLMCGGKKKNSVFGMHTCADTEADLSTAKENAEEIKGSLDTLATDLKQTAMDGEADANAFQKAFGAAGDPTASGLMQEAKVWAGKCQDAAKAAEKVVNTGSEALTTAEGLKGPFKDFDKAKEAETSVSSLNEFTAEAESVQEGTTENFWNLISPPDAGNSDGAAKQYYPIMYFVDKEFENVPSTCGGDLASKPIMGKSLDECAADCDSLVGKCVGFGYYQKDTSLCFLYSKFKSVQFYTGCDAPKDGGFLQVQKKGDIVTCNAKLQDFEGTTLKPNPSGKCDQCLKEATKANRCW